MNCIKGIIKKNKTIYRLLVRGYVENIRIGRLVISYLFCLFPIKKNQIVFSNHVGKGFGDSPKYIAEKIHSKNKAIKIYWLVDPALDEKFPEYINPIKNKGVKSLFIMSTSKFWIDNTRKIFYPYKRKKQIYIQTWHGLLPLKSIEKDAEKYLPNEYIKIAKKDSSMCDYIVSGAKFNTKIYKESFWYNGKILEFGTPRSDSLFENNDHLREKVYSSLKISKKKKVILYAPTFRNHTDYSVYHFDIKKLLKLLKKIFSEEYVLLVRLHPNISNLSTIFMYSSDIIDVTSYPDMQELLIFSDFLITDYSSCMFDMLLLNKPCLLYTKDVDRYSQEERPLYFNFDELPFPQSINEQELFRDVVNFSEVEYLAKVKEFKEKIEFFEDGKASEKLVDFLLEELKY